MQINENKYVVYIVGLEGIKDLGIQGLSPFQHLHI